jgi:hypothetical protein
MPLEPQWQQSIAARQGREVVLYFMDQAQADT